MPFFGPIKEEKVGNLIFVNKAANFGLFVNSSKFTFEPSTLEPQQRPSLLEPCHFNNTSAFENYWWKGVRSCKLPRTCRFYNLVIWPLSSGEKSPLRERGFWEKGSIAAFKFFILRKSGVLLKNEKLNFHFKSGLFLLTCDKWKRRKKVPFFPSCSLFYHH